MAKKRKHGMTLRRWLSLARSSKVRNRLANYPDLEIYRSVITAVGKRKKIDWIEALAILHMIYGWMPTMLRNIGGRTPAEQRSLVKALSQAKRGKHLTEDELEKVMLFANGSIVGASKLLHVIRPDTYPIWDSRVANSFLWKGVSQGTFSNVSRYIEYKDKLSEWSNDPGVINVCAALRNLNPVLSGSPDLRLMELVLFRSKK